MEECALDAGTILLESIVKRTFSFTCNQNTNNTLQSLEQIRLYYFTASVPINVLFLHSCSAF